MSAQVAASAQALAGRVILVVGAHGALGRAAALACAKAGATVVLLGRKVPKLNRVYDAVRAEGAEAVLYPLDLEGATPDDYAEMADRIGEALGRLDGVLHCAADFHGLTPLEHTEPDAFARAVHVNFTARWWLSQACLPLLRAAEDAALVFVIDDSSRAGGAYWGGYGLMQSAVGGLVTMLHAELAGSRVRVSGLMPGPMRTPLRATAVIDEQHAAGPLQDAEAYAPACVHLLSAAGAAQRGQCWAPVIA